MSTTVNTQIGGQTTAAAPPSTPSISPAVSDSLYKDFDRIGIDPNDIQLTPSTDNPNIVHAHITVRGTDTDGVEKETKIVLQIPLKLKGTGESARIAAFKRTGMIALSTHQTALAILKGTATHKFVGAAQGGHAAVTAFFAKGTHLDINVSISGDVKLQAGRYDAIGRGEYTAVEGAGAISITGAKSANISRFVLELTRNLHGPEDSITGNTDLERELDETLKGFDTPLAAEAKSAAKAMRERCKLIMDANDKKIEELKKALDALPPEALSASTQRILKAIAEARKENSALHEMSLDILDHAHALVNAERDLGVIKSLPHSGGGDEVRKAEDNLKAARKNYYTSLARYQHMAIGRGESFQKEAGVSGPREFFTYLRGAIQHRSHSAGREAVVRSRAQKDPLGLHLQDSTLAGIADSNQTTILRNLESADHPTDQLDACMALARKPQDFVHKLETVGRSLIPLALQAKKLKQAADKLVQLNQDGPRIGDPLESRPGQVLSTPEDQCQAMLGFVRQMVPGSLKENPPVLTAHSLSAAFKEVLSLASQLRIDGETEPPCEAFLKLADTLSKGADKEAMNRALNDFFSQPENLASLQEFAKVCEDRDDSVAQLAVHINQLQDGLKEDPEGAIENACRLLGIGSNPPSRPKPLEPGETDTERTDNKLYGMQVLARSLLDSTLGSAERILRGEVSLGGGVSLDIKPMPAMENARLNLLASLGLTHEDDAYVIQISLANILFDLGIRDEAIIKVICEGIAQQNPQMILANDLELKEYLNQTISEAQDDMDAFCDRIDPPDRAMVDRKLKLLNNLLEQAYEQAKSEQEQLRAVSSTLTEGIGIKSNVEAALGIAIFDTSRPEASRIIKGIDLGNPRMILGIDSTTNRAKAYTALRSDLEARILRLADGTQTNPFFPSQIEQLQALLAVVDKANEILEKEEKALAEGTQRIAPPPRPARRPANHRFAAAKAAAPQTPPARASSPTTASGAQPAGASSPTTTSPPPTTRASGAQPASSVAASSTARSAVTAAVTVSSAPAGTGVRDSSVSPSPYIPNLGLRGDPQLRLDQTDPPKGFKSWGEYATRQNLPSFKVQGRRDNPDRSIDSDLRTKLDGGRDVLIFYRYPEISDSALFGNFEHCGNGVSINIEPIGLCKFDNAEAAFHGAKIGYLLSKKAITLEDAQRHIEQLARASGDEAWRFAEVNLNVYLKKGQLLSGEWHRIKGNIMLEVVTAKFSQNPEFAAALLSQEGKVLIENSGDMPGDWSVHRQPPQSFEGKNLLGCALMQAMGDPSVIAAAARSITVPSDYNSHYRAGQFGQQLALQRAALTAPQAAQVRR